MEENFRVFKPYLRGLPIILASMVLAFLAASKYLNYVTPVYESTTKLRLADTDDGVPGANLFKNLDVFASSNKIAVEIEVLKSQVLLEKVLNQLNFGIEIYRVGTLKSVELYDRSPIAVSILPLNEKACDRYYQIEVRDNNSFVLTEPGNPAVFSGKMGDTLQTTNANIVVALNTPLLAQQPNLNITDKYQFRMRSRKAQIAEIQKNLDVIPVDKDVAVIRISYKSPHPVKAAHFANKLAEVYIQDYIDTKYRSANMTVDFLNNQINHVSDKLTGAENNIQSYRETEGITNITQETETDLRKISQMKIQLTNLKMSLQAIAELDRYVQHGKDKFLDLAPNFEAFTDLLSTEMIKKIKALQAEKRDLLLVYTPEDERVKVVDQKLDDVTSYLTESIRNTRINLEIKYSNLDHDIQNAEKVFVSVPEKEKEMNILNRDFQIYQQSYNFLNEKKIEAEIARAAKMSLHRIITPAEIAEKPVAPNRAIIKIVAVMLGMFGSVFFIFLVHMLKARVNGKHTIETNSLIPIATATPKLPNQAAVTSHFLREAARLEVKGLLNDHSVVAVTGFNKMEGSAFTAHNLAKTLASQGRNILLLDVENTLELATGTPTQLEENLHVANLVNPAFERYTKAKMAAMLDEFKANYDLVLLFNAQLESQKTLLLMCLADVNLFVLDARLTPAKRIAEVDLLKSEYNLEHFYFVLNRLGYNPGVLGQARKSVRKFFLAIFKKASR